MTSQQTPSTAEICANVKRMGYGDHQRIRLYGEEFEVISDPFPDAGGIAVHVRTQKDANTRTLRLPATILQSLRGRVSTAA